MKMEAKMNLLVTTTADKKIKEMTDLSHPIIKKFAKKWGADFLVLDKDADCDVPMGRIHYRIMELYNLLDEYDRILNLDSDVVINKGCPNLFDLVPHNEIGTILEDKGTRLENRRNRIMKIQFKWGMINWGWEAGYPNTGVFVVSQPHREIFRKFKGQYWTELGFDCVHLGYQIHRLGLKMFELSYKFNHMSMFSEPWHGSPSRFGSYIIHYAGAGGFLDKGNRSRVELIRDDIKEIYGDEFSR